MNKILFFDIDDTLFNTSQFLKDVRSEVSLKLEEPEILKMDLKEISQEVKREHGMFIPEFFLSKLSERFPKIDQEKLKNTFLGNDLINKNLFRDCSVIPQLTKTLTLGIFSKGDEQWQKRKIVSFREFISDRNIFIYPDKISHIREVLSNYEGFEVTFVDNDIEVLSAIKSVSSKPELFLIDREGNLEDNIGVKKINSLTQLENLI